MAKKLTLKRVKKKERFTPRNVVKWTWEFTKIVISTISIVWVFSTIFSAIMVYYAIKSTGQFSFLDTFIIENSTTFRDVVGINIVKSCIENIFKYNDFFGKKRYNKGGNNTSDSETTESSDEIVG